MQANHSKTDRLILVLGIALVTGGIMAAATYLDLERKNHSAETFSATLDRLCQAQKVSAVLRTIHDGDASAAAQRLDLLLCDNILMINSELAAADDRTRAYVNDAFMRIARIRPKIPDIAAGDTQELNNDQIEAEKILAQASGGTMLANKVATASP